MLHTHTHTSCSTHTHNTLKHTKHTCMHTHTHTASYVDKADTPQTSRYHHWWRIIHTRTLLDHRTELRLQDVYSPAATNSSCKWCRCMKGSFCCAWRAVVVARPRCRSASRPLTASRGFHQHRWHSSRACGRRAAGSRRGELFVCSGCGAGSSWRARFLHIPSKTLGRLAIRAEARVCTLTAGLIPIHDFEGLK